MDGTAVQAAMQADLRHLNEHSDWSEIVERQVEPLGDGPALVALVEKRVVGGAGMDETRPGRYTVSYWVASHLTGRGIATALVRRLVEEGERRGATHLYAGVTHGNVASVRVLEKAGFSRVADFEDYSRFCRPIEPLT